MLGVYKVRKSRGKPRGFSDKFLNQELRDSTKNWRSLLDDQRATVRDERRAQGGHVRGREKDENRRGNQPGQYKQVQEMEVGVGSFLRIKQEGGEGQCDKFSIKQPSPQGCPRPPSGVAWRWARAVTSVGLLEESSSRRPHQ